MLEFTDKWVNDSLVPKVTDWLNKLEPVFRSWGKSIVRWIWEEILASIKATSGGYDFNDPKFWWSLLITGDPGQKKPQVPRPAIPLAPHPPLVPPAHRVPGLRGSLIGTEGLLGSEMLSASERAGYSSSGYRTGNRVPGLRGQIDDTTRSLKDMDKWVKKLTGNDFTHLNIATQDATTSLGNFNNALMDLITRMTGQGGTVGQGGKPVGTGGMLGGERVQRQAPFPGAVRAMSEWAPGDPKTRATQYGAAGTHLQLNDVAMSVSLMKQMGLKLGDYIDILDKSGKVLLAHQHIMDTSWFNNPVRDTHGIELWGRPDIGWASIRPSMGAGELAKMQLGGIVRRPTAAVLGESGPEAVVPLNRAGGIGANVTINYNVTNHIHGGEDLENRMAAIHRRHLDQLHRDMEEVTYRQNRAAFDGASAI
jgi:hypothetical protein